MLLRADHQHPKHDRDDAGGDAQIVAPQLAYPVGRKPHEQSGREHAREGQHVAEAGNAERGRPVEVRFDADNNDRVRADHSENHAQRANYRKAGHGRQQLRTKLANKDEVIAEIMASHIELKKNLGEI